MTTLWNDIRYGVRTLRKSPGFALTSVITLGLGIGATTATFSVADAMLWKPVPLPHLETLVAVVQRDAGDPNNWNPTTPGDVADIRREASALTSLASWAGGLANIVSTSGEPERVEQALVTANYFEVLGVQPVLGRAFQPGEDQPGREREVILSDKLWRRRFGADPGIVGRPIRLDDQDFLVTGVMPQKFEFPLGTEVWTPLALAPDPSSSRLQMMLISMARLKPGQTVRQVAAQLDAIAVRLEKLYPASNHGRRFRALPAHRFLIGEYDQQYVMLLFYAVLFVLLIACVNVANLQFARATGRSREIALRTALGAARWRVVAQLVTENVVLALAGAALGLLVASWGLDLIRAGMPPEIEKYVMGWKEIHLDGRALGFTVAAAVASGILAGLAPAWQLSRPGLTQSLKEGGRGSTSGQARLRLRSVLVTSEMALAVVLLVGAGLMVRGFRTLIQGGAEMEPATLLTLRTAITETKYREPRDVAAFYRQVLEKIGAVPGVRSAAAASALPYSAHGSGRYFTIEGRPVEAGNQPVGFYQVVSASLFQTLHVPLRGGRLLRGSDRADAPPVVVVSERLARRWWPGEALPIGKHIKIGTPDTKAPWLTIVGVVGDVTRNVFDRVPRPTLYLPYEQAPERFMDIGIRSAGDPLGLAPAVAAAIRSVNPEQPISDVRTMEKLIRNNATGLNYVAVMMGVFGSIALVLSVIGVYGVMAYLVSEQTHEIGIRMALGAPRQNVLVMIFRRGMLTTAAGLAIGLAAGFALARLMASLVFGVAAGDPATFVGIPLALITAAALAIYVPARRAMRIDPIVALRYE